jgi:protein TonB
MDGVPGGRGRARRRRVRPARDTASAGWAVLASVGVHLLAGAALLRWGLASPPTRPPRVAVRISVIARAPSEPVSPLPVRPEEQATTIPALVDSVRLLERPPAPEVAAPAAAEARPAEPIPAPTPTSASASQPATAAVLDPVPDADNEPPVYPEAARRAREEGTVVVEVLIDSSGRVTAASISESSGYALLDAAALEAARGWWFLPAREDGVAVAGRLVLPVTFRMRR